MFATVTMFQSKISFEQSKTEQLQLKA